MKQGRRGSKKHGSGGAAALWLLMPLVVLIVLKANLLPQVARYWIVGSSPPSVASMVTHSNVVDATKGMAAPTTSSTLTCNLSNRESNICSMEGDVRIHGKSATVYVVSASTYRPENATVKVRAYARKWEEQVMLLVREVTVRSSPPRPPGPDDDGGPPPPPRCSVQHDVPALMFSTGGYNRNFFHVMADVIIPLYVTAREYNGRVQLLATDYEPKWIAKYKAILAALSEYPVIDLDADDAVRCFPSARVGLESSHRELGIVPGITRLGYTMVNFRDFIISAYSLPRAQWTPVSRRGKKKPRLVMVLRRNSRQLKNEVEAMAAAEGVGFEVIAAGPDDVSDLEKFPGVVNTCDVLMGVHGAGLANMLFLPHNATVVQIVPWGEIRWACRHSYGDPVPDMGLRYLEYEATAEETTLKETYPKDHAVFTDPLSIHNQGFDKMWNIFMNGQHVIVDIQRFTGFLKELYQSITTE